MTSQRAILLAWIDRKLPIYIVGVDTSLMPLTPQDWQDWREHLCDPSAHRDRRLMYVKL
jgi:hypothetical protein